MKRTRFTISIIILLFLIPVISFSQQRNIIIKLKNNTPQEIVNNFRSNSPKSGDNSLSRMSRDLDIKNSREAFKKINDIYKNNDSYKQSGLDRIFIIEVEQSNLEQLLTLGGNNEFVEYIQPNGILKTEDLTQTSFTPNDTYYNSQYYLGLIGMPGVWDITQGDSNVVIGVIDTGLDFLHPDLQKSFKINYGEYGNGKESNGIDDDQNGFIDDWRGWDFTDEPYTGDPARGDYLDPDNDPTDDSQLSHGTAVTGIINASFNNNLGISSVAPNCKVLVMRAFDASGNGEEDDVANAILYGISNGVKIFNFSFGDYTFSNLLRDVIRFAYSRNVFISCSAGNDGRDRLHYPSAYDEVVSVGYSDEFDFKGSQSSFGETVDIYAPGFQNLTTVRRGKGNPVFNGDYEKLNGTSISAPVIAGIAGLLLSRNPNLSNEEIRGILTSSTVLMPGQTGWDHSHSSGRINAVEAIQNFDRPSIARIHYPFQDFTFEDDMVPVCISAASPLFLSYSVYYGVGQNPQNWIPILTNQSSQILNDTVARWNTSALPDTSYTLRLAINSNSGRTIEHRMIVFKDRNPPVITDVSFGNIIDKNNYSELILFATNKRTLGKIFYKRRNVSEPYQAILADVGTPNIGFVADVHFGLLGGNELSPETEYEFYIEAKSLNGKTAVINDPSFHFYTLSQINRYGFNQKNYSLPYSQACNTVFDINGNGLKDIFLNVFSDKLNIFEFNGTDFQKISNGNWGQSKIARDVGDIDSDGKSDLLASDVRNGFVYEAPAPNQLPTNQVWNNPSNKSFWSARIADVNGNGRNEILGFDSSGLSILESSGDNAFTEIANLSYFGPDSEAVSPNAVIDDFDNDGKKEIFFANYYFPSTSPTLPSLALSVFENTSGNIFTRTFTDSIQRDMDDNFNMISGNFLGDGKKEFGIGTVSKDNNLVQYYSLYVYKSTGNDAYAILDVIDIYNYKSYLRVSTQSADIDNDGIDEIMVNVGSYYYVFKFDNSAGRFIPVFYMENINSINQLVYDFDGNGIKEIGLNTVNDTMLFFEKDIAFTGPSTPLNFTGYSLDSNIIHLGFDNVPGADYYRVYRSDTTQNFILYDSSNTNSYSDVNVLNRNKYFYKISAVDIQNPVMESRLSDPVYVFCHNKSRLVSATYEQNGFMSVKFSERIATTIPNLSSLVISNGVGYPKNIALKNNFEYFLTLDNPIVNGTYTINSIGLKDIYNSPVDTNSAAFDVVQNIDTGKFYISKLELSGNFRLKVEFNLEVDSVTAVNTINYTFEPFNLNVISVDIDNANRKNIYLNLEHRGMIGATGKNYLLRAFNIYSSTGIKIVDGAGSIFGLVFNKENLDEMYVYPNPYSMNSNQNYITFANITREASIDIYDLTGKFLININETNGNGGIEWDLTDGGGNKLNTGIYIYRATGKNSSGQDVDEKTGKFAVVR